MRKHVLVLGFLILGFVCTWISAADNPYGIPLAPGEVLLSVNGVAVDQAGCANGKCPLKQAPVSGAIHNAVETATDGLLQWKANQMASRLSCSHVGGGYLSGARAEGVGSSSVSASHAISNACYYGQRPIVGTAVARGSNGVWYGVVQYR